jgi:hypothetical protein
MHTGRLAVQFSLRLREQVQARVIEPILMEKNMHEHPQWKFILMDAQTPIQVIEARIVLCRDNLFHILDDAAYI